MLQDFPLNSITQLQSMQIGNMSKPQIRSLGNNTSVIMNTISAIKHLIELVSLTERYQALGMNQNPHLNLSHEFLTKVAQDACKWVRKILANPLQPSWCVPFDLADQ